MHCAPCRESFFLHSLHCIVLLNHHTASQSVRSHLVVQSFKSKVPPWPISAAIYTTFSISSRIIQLSQPFQELLIIQSSTFWTLWIKSCKNIIRSKRDPPHLLLLFAIKVVVCKKPLTVNQNIVHHGQGLIGFDHTSSQQPRSEPQGQGRQTAFIRGRDWPKHAPVWSRSAATRNKTLSITIHSDLYTFLFCVKSRRGKWCVLVFFTVFWYSSLPVVGDKIPRQHERFRLNELRWPCT